MDLLPDRLITSPDAILYVQRQRQDHEADRIEKNNEHKLQQLHQAQIAMSMYLGQLIIPW